MSFSQVTVRPLSELRQALCCECGAIRHAKAQYLGRGTRILRCEPCGRVTTHAAVSWDQDDDREASNRLRDQGNAEDLRQLEAMVNLFRVSSIEVLCDDGTGSPEAEPAGGLVDVIRWLDPEAYLVRLQRGLPVADRVHCLEWAWKSLLPTVARWDRCDIQTDADGERFQSIYNTEKESGIYEVADAHL
jgi:hypothetical protein